MFKIKRLLSLFLLVFFSILSLHLEPSFSQSSLNACFSSPAAASECASAGLISPQSAANAVRGALTNPSPINPLINLALPSKELVLVLGGVAALSYLRPSDMQKIKSSAPTSSPQFYLGLWRLNLNGSPYTADNYGIPIDAGHIINSPYPDHNLAQKQELEGLGWGYYGFNLSNAARTETRLIYDSVPAGHNLEWVLSPANDIAPPAPSPNYSAIRNSSIYSLAAAAAAAFAKDLANSDTDRMNAALAAIAAAGLVGAGSPDYPMAQDALNSAKAAADALAAAAAAKEQQDKDKALADKLANPSELPSKAFSGSRNFVSYAVGAFASKFPFDLIYGATDASIPSCPSFSLFYYKWELCFLMPIFLTIRWIVFISISTKVVLEL